MRRVRWLAQHGTPEQQKKAKFYLRTCERKGAK
jgi:hypothetical protein